MDSETRPIPPDALTEEEWNYLSKFLGVEVATLAKMSNPDLLRAVDTQIVRVVAKELRVHLRHGAGTGGPARGRRPGRAF